MKKYVLIYDDDNHDKMVWFNREYVSSGLDTIIKSMFYYGIEEGEFSDTELEIIDIWIYDLGEREGLTDEEIDFIHNELCKAQDLDAHIWQAIVEGKWHKVAELCKPNTD